MRSLLLFAFSALTLAACAAPVGAPVEEAPATSTEALTAYSKSLVGAFQRGSTDGVYEQLVLEAGARYFADRRDVCGPVTPACPAVRESGTWSATAPTGKQGVQGKLTLHPTGAKSTGYGVIVASDGSGFKLVAGSSAAGIFDRAPSFCDFVNDCAGQPAKPNVQACMVGATVQLQCRQALCVDACGPACAWGPGYEDAYTLTWSRYQSADTLFTYAFAPDGTFTALQVPACAVGPGIHCQIAFPSRKGQFTIDRNDVLQLSYDDGKHATLAVQADCNGDERVVGTDFGQSLTLSPIAD